ncbi:AhpA/YtjB family protein [Pseudaeromonas paramecii]|uniref:AhpA/YtjB family protein n=1 Tax=Pseudaeromonas paramecii TaxID=2138166 RepID=A0ABP8Q9P8_9GAMM
MGESVVVPKGVKLIRLLYLGSGLVLAIWAMVLTWQVRHDGDLLLKRQSRLLAQTLTSFAAHDAIRYLQPQNLAALQQLVDTLAEDVNLRDATLYDAEGRQLVSSAQAVPLDKLLALAPGETQTPPLGRGRTPFVQELRSDKGDLLGFLRITVEERKMLAAHTEYQQSLFERWRQLLLMMLAAGILLCKGIPRRRWHKVQRHKAHAEEQAEDQTAA